VIRPHPFIEGV